MKIELNHKLRFIVCFLVVMYFQQSLVAQNQIVGLGIIEQLKQKKDQASVSVDLDPKLELILNDKSAQANRSVKGWRIRVFRDNRQDARARAEGVMSSIRSTYPNTPTYMTYQAPYFYVAVGDYRSRDEAEKMKRNLLISYPGSSLIESTINFPPL